MSGKSFDPELIDVFFKHIDEFLKIYNMQLSEPSEEAISKKGMQKIVDWLFKGI